MSSFRSTPPRSDSRGASEIDSRSSPAGSLTSTIRSLYSDVVLKLRNQISPPESVAAMPFEKRILLHHPVIKGNDGFLFHREFDTVEQLSGGIAFSPSQIRVWKRTIRRRLNWCAANSIKVRFLIIPEKHVIYSEHLPAEIEISKLRPLDQLLSSVSKATKNKFLYPVENLRRARSTAETYFRTDTHWTSFGAFTAYRALIESLQREIPLSILSENDLIWQREEQFVVGDLGVRLDPEMGELVTKVVPPAKYSLKAVNQIFDRGAVHLCTGERADLPRCVIFRDSFTNAMIPFLMQSFSRVIAVSTISCLYDLLKYEKPDVVIFASAERYLASYGRSESIELPDDDGTGSFESHTKVNLNDLKRKFELNA